MSECQAKNPATCRVHGVRHITGVVFNEIVKKRQGYGTPEDYFQIVKDISDAIDEAGQPHSQLDDGRDIDGIVDTVKVIEYSRRKAGSKKVYPDFMPVEEIAQYVAWLKDKNANVLPKKNLLDKGLVGKEGITNYDNSLARYMAVEGRPVAPGDRYYGWSDYAMQQHLNKGGCSIAAITSVKEDSWHEFNGTFNDEDDTVHGVTAHGQCKCGFFKGELRVDESMTKIIRDVVNNYV
jgi:hypothetical protein